MIARACAEEVPMRALLPVAAAALWASVCLADQASTHKFKKADLPKVVKVKAGDTIVIIEEAKPADVEESSTTSDNPTVKVSTEGKGDEYRVVIQCDRQGKAKVGWRYTTANGKTGG